MPMLDVSVALTNPYTLDTVVVLRRKQGVNNFGETKTEVSIIENVKAIVFPASKNDLDREPDAQINAKSIVLISRFALRGESETVDGVSYQPDVVQWRGDQFLVVTVEDYSAYGNGFVKMTANSIDIQDRQPMPKPLAKSSANTSEQTGYNVEPFNEGSFNG
jgi:hypothetical protein